MASRYPLIPYGAGPAPASVPGPLAVLRAKAEAWLVREAAEAELAVLHARRRVAEARLATEAAERALEVQRALDGWDLDLRLAFAAQELEFERLRLEWERVRQEHVRLASGFVDASRAVRSGGLEVDVDDRQVEALALRAVARFGGLPPAEAEQAWAAFRTELRQRLPPYAAAQVERRVEELRGLAR